MKISKKLRDFSVWSDEKHKTLELPCKTGMGGDTAIFHDYQKSGVVLIGCGDNEGLEPDKDAFVIDKADVPAVIEFLQASIAE